LAGINDMGNKLVSYPECPDLRSFLPETNDTGMAYFSSECPNLRRKEEEEEDPLHDSTKKPDRYCFFSPSK